MPRECRVRCLPKTQLRFMSWSCFCLEFCVSLEGLGPQRCGSTQRWTFRAGTPCWGAEPTHRVRCPALPLVPPFAFPVIELDPAARGHLPHCSVSSVRQGPGWVLFAVLPLGWSCGWRTRAKWTERVGYVGCCLCTCEYGSFKEHGSSMCGVTAGRQTARPDGRVPARRCWVASERGGLLPLAPEGRVRGTGQCALEPRRSVSLCSGPGPCGPLEDEQ